MKELIFSTILLLMPTWALAGNGDNPLQPQFYFFTAPIVSNTRYYFNFFASPACQTITPPPTCSTTARGGNNTGFGGELLERSSGLGVGIELGYGGPNWSFNGNGAVGVGSVNFSYHFFSTHSRRRVDPFVSGGYSLYFGKRTTFQSGFNVGGGVNLWFARHAALRLEIRDQDGINRYDYCQFTRFAAFRFGMTFR